MYTKIEIYFPADGEIETEIRPAPVKDTIKEVTERLAVKKIYNAWDYVNETLNIYSAETDEIPKAVCIFTETVI